jgi:hypothetical protein
MPVKIKSKKILGSNEYLQFSGITGKTSIKSLEKKYQGEFRLINNIPVIVRPLKK